MVEMHLLDYPLFLWVELLPLLHSFGGLHFLLGMAELRLRTLKTPVQKFKLVRHLAYSTKKPGFEIPTILQRGESIVFFPVFGIPAKVAANGCMALWGAQILQ